MRRPDRVSERASCEAEVRADGNSAINARRDKLVNVLLSDGRVSLRKAEASSEVSRT